MFCKKADLSEMERQNVAAARALSRAGSVAEAAAIRGLYGPYAAIIRDAAAALEQSGAQAAASHDSAGNRD